MQIINPHTGLPAEWRSLQGDLQGENPFMLQRIMESLGIPFDGFTQIPESVANQVFAEGGDPGERLGATYMVNGQPMTGQQIMDMNLTGNDWNRLSGVELADTRQDYFTTRSYRGPDGQFAQDDPRYSRESYNSDDYAQMAAVTAAMIAAGYGLGAMPGASAAGTSTLGAGSLGTPIATSAALPTLGTMSIPTAASLGIGELAALGGGLAGATGTLGTIAPSAATTASSALPTLGQMPAIDPATIGGTLPSLSQLTGGASLIDRITSNPGQFIAPALGAVVGGLDAARGSEDTQTQQSRLDPNMQRLLYGNNGQGGLLNQANAFFQQNQGINPTAQQGLNMSKAVYTDPSYAQGFGQLRSQGLGLLGQPVAGNPFARGG